MLDHDAAEDYMARLGRIQRDAVPRWGRLTRDQLLSHLAETVRQSMGRGIPPPRRNSWHSRITWHLLRRGLLRIPRDVRIPVGKAVEPLPTDLESLHALLLEYLAMVQSGETTPFPHPLFGDIGVDGWARFHTLHFEHHLGQFGV
jgi:hypothetical protein